MMRKYGFGRETDVADPAQLVRPSKIDDISSTAMTTRDIRGCTHRCIDKTAKI